MEQAVKAHGNMSHRVLHVPYILIAFQTLNQLLSFSTKYFGLRIRRHHQYFLLRGRIRNILNNVSIDRRQNPETIHRFAHSIEIP